MSWLRLAVDYGTSTTVAFLRLPDGRVRPLLFDDSPLLPSAVYLEPDGRLLTGRDAVRSARFEPGRFEANPKRRIDDREVLLGDRVLPVEDLIAATLGRVWEEATRIAGARPDGVALTHPATWGELRRNALVRAADRAGLPPIELLPEPVAAATAFATVLGHSVPPGSSVVVYDLGAGTFDVSVVRREPTGFRPLTTDGLVDVGGLDLDAVVVDLVRRAGRERHEALWHRLDAPADLAEQRASRELWDGAREAKESLSRRASVPVPVPGLPEPQHVTREELESAARPVLAQTVSVTAATLRGAGPIAGLFLVGGSTRVPLVASMLHRATGIAPTVIEQPELVVAEGAIHAVVAMPAGRPPSPPGMRTAGMTTPGMSTPGMSTAGMSTAGMSTAGMSAPGVRTAGMTAPGMTAPGMRTAGMTAPGMTAASGMTAPPAMAVASPASPVASLAAQAVTNLEPVAAEPPGPRKRRRGLLAAAGAAAVTLVVVLAVFLWPQGERDAAGDRHEGITVSGTASPADVRPGGAGPAANASASPSGSTAAPSASPKNSPTRRAPGSSTTRPAGPVTVSVALVKTRLTYNGACPPPGNKPILLFADFTASGQTYIDYYWKRDPAYDTATYNLTMYVAKAGTTRSDGFYGGWSNTAGETITYWVQLVVTKPISYTSAQLTWSTTCTNAS